MREKEKKENKTKYLNQNIFVWNIPREQEICLSLPILLRTIRLALHQDVSGIAIAEKIMNNWLSICRYNIIYMEVRAIGAKLRSTWWRNINTWWFIKVYKTLQSRSYFTLKVITVYVTGIVVTGNIIIRTCRCSFLSGVPTL